MTQAFALYLHSPTNPAPWVSAFHELASELEVRVWPEPPPQAEAVYALTWSPPEGFFAAIPNLKGVFALAAGVDRLVNRADLAREIPLVRLTDAGMAQQMIEYVLYGVLRFQRGFDAYAEDQAAGLWRPRGPKSAAETRVLVLGLGELGAQVAQALAGFGYAVAGWSRSPREIEGVDCLHGLEALDARLERVDVLASVLPSTPGTRGLSDRRRRSARRRRSGTAGTAAP
jgi:glyoxylate/hydroxypyruvate reductase A